MALHTPDEFDLDVRLLAAGPWRMSQPHPSPRGRTQADTCNGDCGGFPTEASCPNICTHHTCGGTCNTCPTCATCAGAQTCQTCNACPTVTCRTGCGEDTCQCVNSSPAVCDTQISCAIGCQDDTRATCGGDTCGGWTCDAPGCGQTLAIDTCGVQCDDQTGGDDTCAQCGGGATGPDCVDSDDCPTMRQPVCG